MTGKLPNSTVNSIPTKLVDRRQWAWWRRLLATPPSEIKAAVENWRSLQRALAQEHRISEQWPSARAPGIFGNSIVHAEQLGNFRTDEPLRLRHRASPYRATVNDQVQCPAGSLWKEVTFRAFRFDASEIEGIAASKSSDLHFDSVDEFGKSFALGTKTSLDAFGLKKMLAHGEIRVRADGTGSDRVSIRLWDGRLFLINSGGSHHLAGAAHIARVVGAAIPLSADLTVTAIRPKAVAWLTTNHHVLALGRQTHVQASVSKLAGRCYELSVPDHLAEASKVLMIPRDAALADDVAQLLVEAGATDLAPWFQHLLVEQNLHLQRWLRRLDGTRWSLGELHELLGT